MSFWNRSKKKPEYTPEVKIPSAEELARLLLHKAIKEKQEKEEVRLRQIKEAKIYLAGYFNEAKHPLKLTFYRDHDTAEVYSIGQYVGRGYFFKHAIEALTPELEALGYEVVATMVDREDTYRVQDPNNPNETVVQVDKYQDRVVLVRIKGTV